MAATHIPAVGSANPAGITYIPDAVASQASRRPGALAVSAGVELATYGQLDLRANRLGRVLRSIGVGADAPVGICLRRSIDTVVAAMAIWKAGGAYLPLDPDHPSDRLAYQMEDARAAAVITSPNLTQRVPGGSWSAINVFESHNLAHSSTPAPIDASPDRLAYVIYTSGSTGRPKGVEISHRGLANLAVWHNHTFSVTQADRASHLAGLSFDAAVWELWPYMAAGASVHLVDDLTRNSPELLQDWLIRQRISIGFVPTPLGERLMGLAWPSRTALRVLLTGGDTLQHYPPPGLPFAVINNYGPTEYSVVATSAPVPPDFGDAMPPPIGRPILNTQIHLLDSDLQPVPPGSTGEIYIGGAGIARGYRNNPDLTAECFVRAPAEGARGGILYRTGDLGRLLPDGQIAFLGRVDDQIKIRGHRIEPGEISATLNLHKDVVQSIVLAPEDEAGDRRLVAYVSLAADSTATPDALRTHLRQRLPEFMIPAAFVRMESFPVTSHGKIDRTALPAPTPANNWEGKDTRRGLSETEDRIAKIICQLLGSKKVAPDDNFFMIGGHSLMGAQLIVRLREAFGVEISLRRLFETPTVVGLSAEIVRLRQLRPVA